MKSIEIKAYWQSKKWERFVFPVLYVLGVRLALGVWLGIIWLLIDRYRPDPEFMLSQGYLVYPEQASLWGRMLLDVWFRWDAINFLHVAYEGYATDYYLAFFPLFPLTVHVLTKIVYLGVITPARLGVMGMLISTLSVAIAAIALQELIVEKYGDLRLARFTIVIWTIAPTAIFLFAPFSDALFICLTVCFFLAVNRERWLLAGLLGALDGATRVQGIFLIPPLLFLLARSIYWRKWNDAVKMLPAILLTPLGWGCYFLWSSRRISLLSNYSTNWTTTIRDPIFALIHTLEQGIASRNFVTFFEIATVLFFGLLMILMLKQGLHRKSPELAIYSLVSFVVFISLYRDTSGYISLPRYVLSLFPAFMVLADYLLNKPAIVRKLYLASSLTAMLVISCLYAMWFFIA